jgi:hypothetical protein
MWTKTTPYGDWREYHKPTETDKQRTQMIAALKKIIPNGISPKRLGTKPWYKLCLLYQQHHW